MIWIMEPLFMESIFSKIENGFQIIWVMETSRLNSIFQNMRMDLKSLL